MTDEQNIEGDSDVAATGPDHTQYNYSENAASGVSITGKGKFGSGTRDQATVKIKGKGVTAEKAIEEFETAVEAAEDGDWGHRLLELNPERDGGDDD